MNISYKGVHAYKLLHSCLTLCNPIDCSLPGSFVHGVFQARILEWVTMPFSGDLSNSGIEPESVMHWQVDSLPLAPPGRSFKGVTHTCLSCVYCFLEHNPSFPGGSVAKNSPVNAGNMGSTPHPGRSHIPQSN